jgi:protein gp37
MADHSAIEWTDATWNPIRGCTRVSAGCEHCYAEKVAARFSGPGLPYEGLIHPTTRGWNGTVKLVPDVLDQPLRWKKPRRIFVNSMSDLFHESVPDNYIAAVFGMMAATPQHTYQLLTKRPGRMHLWFSTWMSRDPSAIMHECVKGTMGYHHPRRPAINSMPWPLPNVWLGVSVENQATADERISLLLKCPSRVRWLSCEPLLGSVRLHSALSVCPQLRTNAKTGNLFDAGYGRIIPGKFEYGQFNSTGPFIDWVVAGGESGPDARPMHPDWARSLRDQCAAAGVPFFFKQWGEFDLSYDRDRDDPDYRHCNQHDRLPGRWINLAGGHGFHGERVHHAHKVGKRAAGRLLDGIEHNAYPENANA